MFLLRGFSPIQTLQSNLTTPPRLSAQLADGATASATQRNASHRACVSLIGRSRIPRAFVFFPILGSLSFRWSPSAVVFGVLSERQSSANGQSVFRRECDRCVRACIVKREWSVSVHVCVCSSVFFPDVGQIAKVYGRFVCECVSVLLLITHLIKKKYHRVCAGNQDRSVPCPSSSSPKVRPRFVLHACFIDKENR